MATLAAGATPALTADAMIDAERKKAILQAEQEFERKENLSRALAEKGVTLIGKITSPPHPQDPLAGAPDKASG